ncbi:unnamed protein product, partial [Prunus brigantina]
LDGDRVRLAIFLLKGNTYHWWKTVRRGYASHAAITWEEFQRIFYEQFYPMSVLEYTHKFNELSKFALELISTEEEKCRRFEEGLWLNIQAVVIANTYPTMRALA